MNIEEEYRLQIYQDLGYLDEKKKIRLKRNKIHGNICVEKRVSPDLKYIYDYLKEKEIPGVPEIYECIPDGRSLIIIEEYVTGRTLEAIVRESRMPENEVVRIALEICDILGFLHNAEPVIICRDIKAENIILDKAGHVWLVDFNIARTFQKGKKRDTVILGTAEYAAPEQFGFFQTDNRTDIYALGVLINYMMTGRFPVEEIVQGRLSTLVHKCTYLEPAKRYQNIREVEKELKQLYPLLKSETEKRKRESYALPGFRSHVFWKQAAACIGYLFLIWFCYSMEIKTDGCVLTPVMLRIEQTAIFISQFLFICVVCNYRGWRDEIPIIRSKNIYVRIVGYMMVEIILFFAATIVCGILEMIL